MPLKYHQLDYEHELTREYISNVDNSGKKSANKTEKLVCRWVRDENNKLCCQWEVVGYFN